MSRLKEGDIVVYIADALALGLSNGDKGVIVRVYDNTMSVHFFKWAQKEGRVWDRDRAEPHMVGGKAAFYIHSACLQVATLGMFPKGGDAT